MEELKAQISVLTIDQLLHIQMYVDDLIAEKTSDTIESAAYETIRLAFSKRFADYQVERFAHWRHLKPARQKEFKKAFQKAISYFHKVDKRFKNTEALRNLIAGMVAESPYFYGKLQFDDLILSLTQFDVLFDTNFPGYRNIPGALDLLVEKMK